MSNSENEELMRHLSEQLEFLRDSASAYDEGKEAESKRLAVVVRVLLHDTQTSHSLLGQIGTKDSLKFVDTAVPKEDDNIGTYRGLVVTGKKQFHPMLDDFPGYHRKTDFETWWNEVVIVDSYGNSFTRKNIVRNLSNKDGGAHVDTNLDAAYESLSRQGSMSWNFRDESTGEWKSVAGVEKATMRQIAHEMIKTFDDSYTVKTSDLSKKTGFLIGPMSFHSRKASPEEIKQKAIVTNIQAQFEALSPNRDPQGNKIGRNDPCYCKSGLKFKRCHGK